MKDKTEKNTESSDSKNADRNAYWRANLRVVTILLAIWFVVAYGMSIFFIAPLNSVRVGNVGLGFWMAQQGSIYVFVVLVAVYAFWMDRLDGQFGVRE